MFDLIRSLTNLNKNTYHRDSAERLNKMMHIFKQKRRYSMRKEKNRLFFQQPFVSMAAFWKVNFWKLSRFACWESSTGRRRWCKTSPTGRVGIFWPFCCMRARVLRLTRPTRREHFCSWGHKQQRWAFDVGCYAIDGLDCVSIEIRLHIMQVYLCITVHRNLTVREVKEMKAFEY